MTFTSPGNGRIGGSYAKGLLQIDGDRLLAANLETCDPGKSLEHFVRSEGGWQPAPRLFLQTPSLLQYATWGEAGDLRGDLAVVGAPGGWYNIEWYFYPRGGTWHRLGAGDLSDTWIASGGAVRLPNVYSGSAGASVSIGGTLILMTDPANSVIYFGRTNTWPDGPLLPERFGNGRPNSGERFGWAVHWAGDRLLVGALMQDRVAEDGAGELPPLENRGTAMDLRRSGNDWVLAEDLPNASASSVDYFGSAIASLGDGRLLVGSSLWDANSTYWIHGYGGGSVQILGRSADGRWQTLQRIESDFDMAGEWRSRPLVTGDGWFLMTRDSDPTAASFREVYLYRLREDTGLFAGERMDLPEIDGISVGGADIDTFAYSGDRLYVVHGESTLERQVFVYTVLPGPSFQPLGRIVNEEPGGYPFGPHISADGDEVLISMDRLYGESAEDLTHYAATYRWDGELYRRTGDLPIFPNGARRPETHAVHFANGRAAVVATGAVPANNVPRPWLLIYKRVGDGWELSASGAPGYGWYGPDRSPPSLAYANGRYAVGNPLEGKVTIVSLIPEAEPSALRVDAATTASIAISWQDITRNEAATDIFLAEAEPFPAGPALTVDADVTTATLSGLAANTRYFAKAIHRNEDGPGPESASIEAWTLAEVPGAPELVLAETAAITLTLATDANPGHTEYAIYSPTLAAYVQRGGSLAAAPDWQTRAEWGAVRIGGLAPAAEHTFVARSRNGAGVESADGAPLAARTFAPAGVIVR